MPRGDCKSMKYNGYEIDYDQQGHMIRNKIDTLESRFEVNELGYTLSQIIKNVETGELISECTYEYDNPGKYMPQDIGTSILDFDLYGYLPHLSKVISSNNNVRTTYEYKFEGDNMLYITTVEGEPYSDTIYVKYNGAYPLEFSNGNDFVGPITYYENGMFKEYKKGTINPETGKAVSESHYKYIQVKDFMCLEELIEVADSITSTTKYTYNEIGNEIREEYSSTSGESHIYETSYKYDQRGNFIESIKIEVDAQGLQIGDADTLTIIYEYWQ